MLGWCVPEQGPEVGGSGGDLGVQCVHGHLLVAAWASGLHWDHLTFLWFGEFGLSSAVSGSGWCRPCVALFSAKHLLCFQLVLGVFGLVFFFPANLMQPCSF